MREHYKMFVKENGKISQSLIISILIIVTILISISIWWSSNKTQSDGHGDEATTTEHSSDEHGKESHEDGHVNEGEITLTAQQMVEQGLKFDVVSTGLVEKVSILPGKLVVNTDQQAHVSPNFSGHVEQVKVALGQSVKQGQTLAVLTVPELIDQQSNLRIAQANLDLARQDYQREQTLWSQGISAKQDYQRAENAYRQAQISTQSAQARLRALGVDGHGNGSFLVKAPISGVISKKDIVVGENVQLADQLFVIEQLKDLWLEFNLPNQFSIQYSNQVQAGQKIQFKVNGSNENYSAIVQSLTSQADTQTGRLVVRAKLDVQANELRPNVMVNVLISEPTAKSALRVKKTALQKIEGEDVIFIIESEQKGQLHLKAQKVQLGQASSDGQWLEIISGLNAGQKYIAQGSFLLKSELEKDEAGHEH